MSKYEKVLYRIVNVIKTFYLTKKFTDKCDIKWTKLKMYLNFLNNYTKMKEYISNRGMCARMIDIMPRQKKINSFTMKQKSKILSYR